MEDAVNIIGSGIISLIGLLIKQYYSDRKTRRVLKGEIDSSSNKNLDAIQRLIISTASNKKETDVTLSKIISFIVSNKKNNNKKFGEIDERLDRIEKVVNIKKKK